MALRYPPFWGFSGNGPTGNKDVKVSRDIGVNYSHAACRIHRRVHFQRCDPRDFVDPSFSDLPGERRTYAVRENGERFEIVDQILNHGHARQVEQSRWVGNSIFQEPRRLKQSVINEGRAATLSGQLTARPCRHHYHTRQGTNASMEQIKCKDCGDIIFKYLFTRARDDQIRPCNRSREHFWRLESTSSARPPPAPPPGPPARPSSSSTESESTIPAVAT